MNFLQILFKILEFFLNLTKKLYYLTKKLYYLTNKLYFFSKFLSFFSQANFFWKFLNFFKNFYKEKITKKFFSKKKLHERKILNNFLLVKKKIRNLEKKYNFFVKFQK